MGSDRGEEGSEHHLEELALAQAWALLLLQEHAEGGTLDEVLHMEGGHSLEVGVGLVVVELFLHK